ncbi:MAG: hypothetical protein QOF89_5752 [Acidobacteriota bacterium]|jgi:hypothetical protein|nr:hypothetical protein [Acidobacteriota bacterium]
MRCSRRLLVLTCLASGLLALAPAGFAREAGTPVQLVAPRAGATLAAGSMAELEWTPAGTFAGLSQVEEWEAFLSVDGGATYPMRITPHLDQDLRRIYFQVPPVPTADARILLRFGDERRETAIELPERFTIKDSLARSFLPVHRAGTLGEPALPGHAGVVAWVEGSRRGGSLRQVVAAEIPGLQARIDPPLAHDETAVLASEPAPAQSPEALSESSEPAIPPASRRAAGARARNPSLSSDILLRTQRQNE